MMCGEDFHADKIMRKNDSRQNEKWKVLVIRITPRTYYLAHHLLTGH